MADYEAQGLAAKALGLVTPITTGLRYPPNASDVSAIRQVATNSRSPDARSGTNISFICRSSHRAREALTQAAIVLPNWYWDRSASKYEGAAGGSAEFTATIEYPSGTFTRVTFDGQTRAFLGDNETLVSDLVTVSIPKDAQFWVRVWCLSAQGIVYSNYAQYSTDGEMIGIGSTAATDHTANAAWAGSAGSVGCWPIILAPAARASAVCLGDSITGGINDTYDAAGIIGASPRAVGATNAFINIGSSGDSLYILRANYGRRLQAARYSKNAICGYGVNDIGDGQSLAQVQANMLWLWSLLPTYGAQRVFQNTITPKTTSSDSWATTANQTAATNFSTAGNGTREQLNDWLRDGAPILNGAAVATGSSATGTIRAGEGGHPLYDVFDVASVVESGLNSGKWKVDGTANTWTADGVHPSQYAYQQIASSGVIEVASLLA